LTIFVDVEWLRSDSSKSVKYPQPHERPADGKAWNETTRVLSAEHLPCIFDQVKPSAPVVIFPRITLELASNKDIGPCASEPITISAQLIGEADVQLSFADRPRDRLVRVGNASSTFAGTESSFTREK
jgi:hypothetical protein